MSINSQDPLKAMSGPVTPPPRLKERVTDDLRRRGLLAAQRQKHPGRLVMYLAASAALLLLGFAAGRTGGRQIQDSSPRFALLLYEDAQFKRPTHAEELVNEYSAWARGLRGQGKLVLGEALRSDSNSILSTDTAGVAIRPGDASSDLGALSGFFISRAENAAAAMAVARDCPHLRHGGRVLLKPIFPT